MKTGTNYADIYYIFQILHTSKNGVNKTKLRTKVSCNGIRYRALINLLIDKKLLESGDLMKATDTGLQLIHVWGDVLKTLGLGDPLFNFSQVV